MQALRQAAVVGARSSSQLVRQDDWVIVDGDSGVMIVDPSPIILAEYGFKQRQGELERSRLSRLRHTPAVTLDGQKVELVANIEMPDDAPGTCTGPDAQKVAAYIFDAFYSPAAQAHIQAPRAAFAHLTVPQYRYAVADLVGGIAARKASESEPTAQGLRGEYFTSGGKRKRTPAFARRSNTSIISRARRLAWTRSIP